MRAGFDSRRGEGAEVVQVFGDDRVDDVEVQAGVFMHGHIAKPDHPMQARREVGWENARGL